MAFVIRPRCSSVGAIRGRACIVLEGSMYDKPEDARTALRAGVSTRGGDAYRAVR